MAQIGLRVQVTGFEEAEEAGEKFVVYIIRIHTNSKTWFIKKRFSDIHGLSVRLDLDAAGCPPFPAKKVKMLGLSHKELDDRRLKLEVFLQALAKKQSITAAGQIEFLTFLEVYSRQPLNQGTLLWPEAADASEYSSEVDAELWARLQHSKPIIEGYLQKRAVKSGRNFRER
jgi:hypothetical protein